MPLTTVNLYVDGANFFAQQKRIGASIDLSEFGPEIASRLGGRLGSMHYFAAPAPWADSSVRDRQDAFFRMVERLDNTELHLGRHLHQYGPGNREKWVLRGVTGALVAQLALDSAMGEAEIAVVVTGNTEYAEAIREVNARTGVKIVWGHFPSQRGLVDLFDAAGEDIEFGTDFLRAVSLVRGHGVHSRPARLQARSPAVQ